MRIIMRVGHIAMDGRHVGYELDERGVADRSKPLIERTATVRMSVVDPDGTGHPNRQVWKGVRISGDLTLTGIDQALAAGFKEGGEYPIDIEI